MTISRPTGQEHFVEMSAYEAAEMLRRRQQSLEEEAVLATGQNIGLDDSSILASTTPAGEGRMLDISEEYDEELHGPLQHSPPAAMPTSKAGGVETIDEQAQKLCVCSSWQIIQRIKQWSVKQKNGEKICCRSFSRCR